MANINGLTSSGVKQLNEAIQRQSAQYVEQNATKLYETVDEDLSFGSGIDKSKFLAIIEEYLSSSSGKSMNSKEQAALQATIASLKTQIEKLYKTYDKKQDEISEKQERIAKKGEEISIYLEQAENATETYIATQTAVINSGYSYAWKKLNNGEISANQFSSTMKQFIYKNGKRSLTSVETEKYLNLVDANKDEVQRLAQEAESLINQKNALTTQLGTLKSIYKINCQSLQNQAINFNNDFDASKPAYSPEKLDILNSLYLNNSINVSAQPEGETEISNEFSKNPQMQALNENWSNIITTMYDNNFSFKEVMYALFDSNTGLFKNCGITYSLGQKDASSNPTYSIGTSDDESTLALYDMISSTISKLYDYNPVSVQSNNVSQDTDMITDTSNIFDLSSSDSSGFALSKDEVYDIVSESYSSPLGTFDEINNIFMSIMANASSSVAQAKSKAEKAESDMNALEVSTEAKGKAEIKVDNFSQSESQKIDSVAPIMNDVRSIADKEKVDIDINNARQIYYALQDKIDGEVTATMVFREYQNRQKADNLSWKAASEINSKENAQYVDYNDLYNLFASGKFKSVDDAVNHFTSEEKEQTTQTQSVHSTDTKDDTLKKKEKHQTDTSNP